MEVENFLIKIGFDKNFIQKFKAINISYIDLLSLKVIFYENFYELKETLKTFDDPEFIALIFYINMALDTYDIYKKYKISDQIYFDTMRDIYIWAKDYRDRKGKWGLEELDWLAQSIRMEIFRLGRLQFEEKELEKNIGIFKVGDKYLSVHIAKDGPLNIKSCQESFKMARNFYADEDIKFFFCKSWLVSPRLDLVLGKDSNIIKFKELFKPLDITFEYPQAEERIFGEILKDKSKYPEDTSLRKNYKKLIEKGIDIGIGSAYIEFKKIA
ncbi:MAG: acyltransferase domain-containing protein [Finegoldia sp.]|nr:acyltransferase domain-containing protein [Finegoldia sp.]